MKKLKDDHEVPARCWYYLLDFNDRDSFNTLNNVYFAKSLSELVKEQFWALFKYATEIDLIDYNK